jgi:hypothetical protein
VQLNGKKFTCHFILVGNGVTGTDVFEAFPRNIISLGLAGGIQYVCASSLYGTVVI